MRTNKHYVDSYDSYKYIELSKLVELLKKLPDKSRLAPNRVGNISILNELDQHIGYIDINEEYLELY